MVLKKVEIWGYEEEGFILKSVVFNVMGVDIMGLIFRIIIRKYCLIRIMLIFFKQMCMGKGKGFFDYWVVCVVVNQVIFEICGVFYEQVI